MLGNDRDNKMEEKVSIGHLPQSLQTNTHNNRNAIGRNGDEAD
jgi:hypothetical protein